MITESFGGAGWKDLHSGLRTALEDGIGGCPPMILNAK